MLRFWKSRSSSVRIRTLATISRPSTSARVLLVGSGRMGSIRASILHSNPRFDLCGLVDPMGWRSDLPEKYMIPVFQTVIEAVRSFGQDESASSLDALVVCCPTTERKGIIEQAARNNLHVFTEKPVGDTAILIQELYEIAESAKIKLCCGFQRRFDPSYVTASQAVAAGEIGKPIAAHLVFADHPVPPREFLLSGGDIFMDLSAHDVDFITHTLDDRVISVYATATSSDADLELAGCQDNATILLKFERGSVVTLFLSRSASYGYDQRCEIFGEKGLVSVGNIHSNATVLSNQTGCHHALLQNSFPERFKEAFSLELDAFADTVLHDKRWPVSKEQCILVQRIADAARLSAETAAVVAI